VYRPLNYPKYLKWLRFSLGSGGWQVHPLEFRVCVDACRDSPSRSTRGDGDRNNVVRHHCWDERKLPLSSDHFFYFFPLDFPWFRGKVEILSAGRFNAARHVFYLLPNYRIGTRMQPMPTSYTKKLPASRVRPRPPPPRRSRNIFDE